MKYYFCVDEPWENTTIWTYDSLEDLKIDNKVYMEKYKDWYIIKGEEINLDEKGD